MVTDIAPCKTDVNDIGYCAHFDCVDIGNELLVVNILCCMLNVLRPFLNNI